MDMAHRLFLPLMKNKQVIHHIDNLPDTYGLVKGSSKSLINQAPISTIIKRSNKLKDIFSVYYAWIATTRNVGDSATRLDKIKFIEEQARMIEWLEITDLDIPWNEYLKEFQDLRSIGVVDKNPIFK